VNGYTCECLEGFSGDDCETEVNECDPNPCENGGECDDEVGGYICECPEGFSGDDCETDIDYCDSEPCQNGGECIDGLTGYTCECDGYLGENCDLPMFETVTAPNGYEYCSVAGISEDGTYMAVNCLMSYMYVFRWSRAEGLEEVPTPSDVFTMNAVSISADGSQIVGDVSAAGTNGDVDKVFRWLASSGQVSFYQPYQANQGAEAYGASEDGSRILGVQSGLQSGAQLLLWTSTTSAPTRYQPSTGDQQSNSGKLSGDGKVVVGISYNESTYARSLVRWTGPTTRQTISSSAGFPSVYDVNYDGTVAVGTSDAYTSGAWVWRAVSGITELPSLGSGTCAPGSISADGARIVGSCTDGTGSAAVMWEDNQVKRIATVLTDAGADLLGTPLTWASQISPDGSTVAGGQGLAFWIGRLPD
jgi:Notch-like protein